MHITRLSRVFYAAVLLTIVASPLVLRADQGGVRPLQINLTEDFGFFGCPDGVDPNVVDTCGTAHGYPFGHALVGTVITAFFPLPSGCFSDSHTSTLDYGPKGVLGIDITGALCPTGGPNFNFTGRYHITGGTGIFVAAQGEGLVRAFRNDGPIQAELLGMIQLRDQ